MSRTLERRLKRLFIAILRLFAGTRPLTTFNPGSAPRILVIRQHNQLGDMLCVVPFLRALRATYPRCTLALLASPVNADVMLHNRFLDEVILYDKSEFIGTGGHLYRFVGFLRRLRNRRFDVAVVPSTVSTSFTSDLLARLSGAALRVGAGSIDGQANPSAFFFTHPRNLDWRENPDRPQVERNIDIWPGTLRWTPDLSLELTLTKDETEYAKTLCRQWLTQWKGIIVYHPGAGKLSNRWPAERFAEAANWLSEKGGMFPVVTAGPMDEAEVRVMARSLRCRHYVVKNQPIRAVAAILQCALLVVTNDTGIMHVAAAAGTPVLALFGPTSPKQWAPRGDIHRYCRGDGGAIDRISVDEVLRNAREMLGLKEET